jgi:hypothetical protein
MGQETLTMIVGNSVKFAMAAASLVLAGSALAEPLPLFGHYAASGKVTGYTPSGCDTAFGLPASGSQLVGEFSLNTVSNVPAQFLRYVGADSQTVYRENFIYGSGKRYNQSGTVKIVQFSYVSAGVSSKTVLPVTASYTAQLADYDPNSFGGVITVTFESGSNTCAQSNDVAFIRTSAD